MGCVVDPGSPEEAYLKQAEKEGRLHRVPAGMDIEDFLKTLIPELSATQEEDKEEEVNDKND